MFRGTVLIFLFTLEIDFGWGIFETECNICRGKNHKLRHLGSDARLGPGGRPCCHSGCPDVRPAAARRPRPHPGSRLGRCQRAGVPSELTQLRDCQSSIR